MGKKSNLVRKLREDLGAAGIPRPVEEHRFHSTRMWRFDLAWPDRLVAVEVHGGTWIQGRHNRGDGYRGDREKMNEAALLGWLVIEVTAEHIKTAQALRWVREAFRITRSGAARPMMQMELIE